MHGGQPVIRPLRPYRSNGIHQLPERRCQRNWKRLAEIELQPTRHFGGRVAGHIACTGFIGDEKRLVLWIGLDHIQEELNLPSSAIRLGGASKFGTAPSLAW